MGARRRRRFTAVLAGLGALWLLVAARLVQLQVVDHAAYADEALRQQTERTELRPARGALVDRRGRILAEDIGSHTLTARPALLRRDRRAIPRLAAILRIDSAELSRRLSRHPKCVILARGLTPQEERAIRAAQLPGLTLTRETTRVYPYEALARAVLGRTGADGHGLEGLELAYDEMLRGTPGWATLVRDGHGALYPSLARTLRPPEDGRGLLLTLDADYQAILEQALSDAVAEHHAKCGAGVIVEPRSGDIVAMATVEGLPPAPGHEPRNRAIADQFEPGSTFKIVTASGALEEHVIRPETIVFCENGHARFGSATLHDAHAHGFLPFRDVFAQSSNIGTAKVGLILGRDRLYAYARRFGFGSPTGIGLPGEASGKVRAVAAWSGRSTATVSIGQEVSVTPLQLAMAYAALANDGVLMAPRIVRGVTRPDGGPVRAVEPRAVERVVSVETARTLRSFLAAVVDSGTATIAHLDWTEAGGKTGTAQKYDAAHGGYGSGKYLSSFVGMVPVDDPRLVCAIMIDEPAGQHYGGLVAAPVWKDVIESLARLPEAPIAPSFRRIDIGRGQWAGTRAAPRGAPAAGAVAPASAPRAEMQAAPLAVPGEAMPDLVGVTLRDALRSLRGAGAVLSVHGAGIVVRQVPASGAPLKPHDTVLLLASAGPDGQAAAAGRRAAAAAQAGRTSVAAATGSPSPSPLPTTSHVPALADRIRD